MGNITIHDDCTYEFSRFAAFYKAQGVQSAFLLNANPDQIQYVLDNVSGIVVVRVYDPFNEKGKLGDNFEKDIVLRHTGQDYVNWIASSHYTRFRGNKRVRFSLGWNEMYYVDSAYQRKQNKAMCDISAALIAVGYGVAMWGLAADKTLQSQDVDNGVWDEDIQFLIDNSDWAHLDVHEYEVGGMAGQHLKSYPVPYPQSTLDPVSMAQSNWQAIPYEGAAIAGNWHVGRIAWLLDRSRKRHGKDFLWARGECGWDYKDDGSLRSFIPHEFMPQFGKPQGLISLRKYFAHLHGKDNLSDNELSEIGYKEIKYLADSDPASCLSNAVFAKNPRPEHAPFNIGLLPRFLELLGTQQSTPVPPPTPAPTPTPEPSIPMIAARIRSKAPEGTRIRKAPIAGAILGIIPNTWTDADIQADYNSAAWPKLVVNGLSGYAAKEWLEVEIDGRLYSVIVGDDVLLVTKESLEDIIKYQEMLVDWLRKLSE